MAGKTNSGVDVFEWLLERGLITDANDASQRRMGILWLKRNMPNVDLVSPKRGCYRAKESELESAFNAHLTYKKQVSAEKTAQAARLNATNVAIKQENARRVSANQDAMTRAERATWLATKEAQDLIDLVLKSKTSTSAKNANSAKKTRKSAVNQPKAD